MKSILPILFILLLTLPAKAKLLMDGFFTTPWDTTKEVVINSPGVKVVNGDITAVETTDTFIVIFKYLFDSHDQLGAVVTFVQPIDKLNEVDLKKFCVNKLMGYQHEWGNYDTVKTTEHGFPLIIWVNESTEVQTFCDFPGNRLVTIFKKKDIKGLEKTPAVSNTL